MKTWTVKEPQIGERLDRALLEKMGDLSRSAIQKMIKDGRVLVNKKSASVHQFLKIGDKISFESTATTPRLKRRSIILPAYPPARLPASLKIIDETADYLVIDKPSGLLVHPDANTSTGTLVDLLLAHDPKIARVGERPEAPGIVHRLDREVSGLMVVAKNQNAYESLQKQFAQRKTEKVYLALVYGEISKDEGDIKFRIARSRTQARMAARPKEQEGGKAAWTHYEVKTRYRQATLVELRIFSGRTHQIRAHLFALGHPVIGDELYALKRPPRNITAPRIMLQSIGLGFDDPSTGKRKTYHLNPDPAFDAMKLQF